MTVTARSFFCREKELWTKLKERARRARTRYLRKICQLPVASYNEIFGKDERAEIVQHILGVEDVIVRYVEFLGAFKAAQLIVGAPPEHIVCHPQRRHHLRLLLEQLPLLVPSILPVMGHVPLGARAQ